MKQFIERTVDGRWLPQILFPNDTNKRPQLKVFLKERKSSTRLLSSWLDSVGLNAKATQMLDDVIGRRFVIYPKPVELVEILARQSTGEQKGVILDFFAGSGTTGHAVINLNRDDGGRRKFILVEMADYFDTVLLPRIKKVTFTPEWKSGRPKRMATEEEIERSPRIVKVMRLESYEDALNNIAFEGSGGQQAMQFEDYLLQYMLLWESRQSETLLNVETLSKPFDYALHIHCDGETHIQKVDLPETFNYLIGLDVEARRVLDDGDRRYLAYRGVTREGQQVAVIWRETEGWKQTDYERDRDFVVKYNLTDGAEAVFVNGDSLIPCARALESVFKQRMFAPVEG